MTKFGMMKKNSTGFLILPSRRRLQDYKNYFKPERGFTPNIMYDLYKVKYFSDKEWFVVLLIDEMKIQEKLVWDKHMWLGDTIVHLLIKNYFECTVILHRMITWTQKLMLLIPHVIYLVVQKTHSFTFFWCSTFLKTAQNCLLNSGSCKCTCYWQNGEMLLLWNHIADIFYEDKNVDFLYLQNYVQRILN